MSPDDDNLISGGPIKRFRTGWAIFPFRNGRAHHWNEIKPEPETGLAGAINDGGRIRLYQSECGLRAEADRMRPALDPGNFPRCRACSKVMKRWNPNAAT